MHASSAIPERTHQLSGLNLPSFVSKASIALVGMSALALFATPAKAFLPIASFSCTIGATTSPPPPACDPTTPVQLGDKSLKFNFATLNPPGTTAKPVTVTYSWADTDGIADLSFGDDVWLFEVKTDSPAFGPFDLVYSYDVTIKDGVGLDGFVVPPGASDPWYFNQLGLESDVSPLTTGTVVFKDGKSGDEIGTLKSTDGQSDGPPIYKFIGNYKTITVTDTLNVSAGASITSVTNAWNQRAGVPGPLPILGAAAAFGYSRKIRRRIKLVA